MNSVNSSSLNKFSIFAIFIIISIFYIVCFKFSYNFFYQDDFHLLRFVTIFEDDSINFQEKLNALYNQHNEHRIIFPRLIVLLDYYLQRHVDWRVLNVFSALYYLGIFAFFALIIKKLNLAYWYILPVALFIFQPSAYQNYYWTISILQQVGNVFWGMFLFYSLIYFQPKKFWISLLLIIVLTFTHGNGLFAFGIGSLLLFLQKRYQQLIIWIVLMIVVAAFYFHGYYTAQNSNIAGSLSDPIRLIGCFGGFWGGFIYDLFKSKHQVIITIWGGLLIFSLLVIFNLNLISTLLFKNFQTKFQKYFPQENLFLFACFLYLFITAALVALSRSWTSIEAGYQNRYLHNSVIAFVLLYVTILHYKSQNLKKTVGLTMLILGLLFNISSWYSNYELLCFQRESQEADAVNYQNNKISIVNDKLFNQNIATILEQSYDKKISVFPKTDLQNALSNLDKITVEKPIFHSIVIQKDSLLEFNIANSHYNTIYYLTNFSLPYAGDVYIILKSPQNTFVSATSHRRNSKLNLIKTRQFFTDGFMTTIPTDAMPKNEYQVGILQNVKNHFIYQPTNYKIRTR